MTHPISLFPWNRVASQSLMVGAIATAAILTGLAPNLSIGSEQLLSLDWSAAAQAQDVSNEEVSNYARAALNLEARRLSAMQEIQKIVGDVPRVVCSDTSSINTLPGNAPRIAVDFCSEARKIIERNRLTVSRFNEITRRQQTDVNFRQRIQAEMLRLREAQNQ